jgi:hypothetical protein
MMCLIDLFLSLSLPVCLVLQDLKTTLGQYVQQKPTSVQALRTRTYTVIHSVRRTRIPGPINSESTLESQTLWL